ncbi:hypothetical protein CSUI_002155 [Cystoisospora suis]|uniref:Transmembrane protein n=1 Tax=Cystoisospora suis TaxID=483139 RepID=A0A2C6KIY7_9APIC|nr:hypothetical protein CSUI_002155 [Cystoisospora suis]
MCLSKKCTSLSWTSPCSSESGYFTTCYTVQAYTFQRSRFGMLVSTALVLVFLLLHVIRSHRLYQELGFNSVF